MSHSFHTRRSSDHGPRRASGNGRGHAVPPPPLLSTRRPNRGNRPIPPACCCSVLPIDLRILSKSCPVRSARAPTARANRTSFPCNDACLPCLSVKKWNEQAKGGVGVLAIDQEGEIGRESCRERGCQ